MEVTEVRDTKLEKLKSLVEGAYDLQKVRIQIGNRICQQFRHHLGIKSSDSEEMLEKKQQKLLNAIIKEYALLADGINEVKNNYEKVQVLLDKHNGIISDFADAQLLNTYSDALASEKVAFQNLSKVVEKYPLWTHCMKHISGMGPTSCAILLAKIDIKKVRYVSNIYKYAGLDVVIMDRNDEFDGRGRGRFKGHQISREYIDKNGDLKHKESITFNPWLKSKLLAVFFTNLKRAGNAHYMNIYNNYLHRLNNDPKRKGIIKTVNNQVARVFEDGLIDYDVPSFWKEILENPKNSKKEFEEFSKARKHKMAVRYTVKILLADIYEAWKRLEGEEPLNPYFEDKLDLQPHTKMVKIGEDYILCDYITGKPVNQKRIKKVVVDEEDILPEDVVEEEIISPRQKVKRKGGRTSKAVKEKIAALKEG